MEGCLCWPGERNLKKFNLPSYKAKALLKNIMQNCLDGIKVINPSPIFSYLSGGKVPNYPPRN
jgi:hypothetical protein